MKHRALAYCGVVLGVAALVSLSAEPMVSAQSKSNTGPTASIVVTCRSTGVLFVDYTYSGFSGGTDGVDFLVAAVGPYVFSMKGGTGEVTQAFNRSTVGSPIAWGSVGAQLVGHSGKVIAGSTLMWNNSNPYTC